MADVLASAAVEIRPVLSGDFRARLDRELKQATTAPAAAAGRQAGDRFSRGITDALTAVGAFAVARRVGQFFKSTVDEALEFESAFTGVRKTVDASEEEFSALEQQFRDLSKEIPASAAEIANVAETAGQLGIAADDIAEFTETAIALGEATPLSAEAAATGLARLANITQLPIDQIENLGSALVQLGNVGASTEDAILDVAVRIAGAGKIAGLAESDILAIGGALGDVGVDAERGGTAVQKVLIAITQSVSEANDDLEIFAQVAGQSSEEFARSFREDAAGAFASFVEGLGRQGDRAFSVLEELGLADQRLIAAFLALGGAGDLLRTRIEQSSQAMAEGTALATEAEKRYATNAARLEVLRNTFDDVKISIGGVLAEGLIPLLEVVSELPAPVIAAGAAFIGLGAAAIGLARVAKIFTDLRVSTLALGASGSKLAALPGIIGKISIAAVGLGLAIPVLRRVDEILSTLDVPRPELDATTEALLGLADGALEADRVLAQLGFGEAFSELEGIQGLRTPTEFVQNFTESVEVLDQALVGLVQSGATDAAAQAFAVLSAEALAAGATTEQLPRIFDDYTTASKQAATGNKVQAAAMKQADAAAGGLEEGLEDLTVGSDDLTDAVSDTRAAFDAITESLEAWGQELEATLGVQLGVEESTDRLREAEDELRRSLKESAGDLRSKTEAGRENRANLRDLIDAELGYVDALVREGRVSSDQASIQEAQIRRLQRLREQFPSLRSQIDSYIESIRAIPLQRETKITADTTQAITRLDRLQEVIDAAVRSREIRFGFSGGTGTATGGLIGPAIGAMGRRAQTGALSRRAGDFLIVGERGPEPFFPSGAGEVKSHETLLRLIREALGPLVVGRGSGATINVFDVAGDKEATAREIDHRLNWEASR